MLLFSDKNELKKRIKELEESLSEANLLKKRYKERVEELNKHVTSMDYHYEAEEKRWAEKLESYEESLKRRDLKLSSMELLHEQLEEQIESIEEELEKASEGSVAMCRDLRHMESAYNNLVEENSHLRKELEEAVAELNGCKPSKSPYPTVTINVDVRDVLAKQLAKSLKQVNEAFEKRYKKKYEYTKAGTSKYYKCTTLDELLNELNSTYWIKEADLNSLREAYESLEEIFNEEGKAYATLSFYSIEYGSHIYIMAGIIKEEI
ncbi:hypothetical protein EFP10_112 [Enterococcus phage EF-P10]|nr:hypothetical protein EFP10_112 [Enterococcus phage EF-P10]